jgi:hypothetical protein
MSVQRAEVCPAKMLGNLICILFNHIMYSNCIIVMAELSRQEAELDEGMDGSVKLMDGPVHQFHRPCQAECGRSQNNTV